MTRPVLAAALLALCACGLARAAPDVGRVYAFQATLDGRPIGQHRFDVVVDGEGAAGTRRVTSQADFTVRVLGFAAYRYHHHADETWTGDCLSALSSTTDDDGKPDSVRLVHDGGGNAIDTPSRHASEPGCLMSYAYWNPALREQTRLLNPQTGRVDAVRVERAGTGTVAVGGRQVDATRWRITGGDSPVDVWISTGGDWVGLDSLVDHGRHRLSYRLP